MYGSIGEALRHAAFNVASIISTTGFSTTDFAAWPTVACIILVLLMFIGACAGSTGGGMKVSRFIILIKGARKEIKSMIHPRRVQKVKVDSREVESEVVRSVNAYIAVYVIVFAVSTLLIAFNCKDVVTSFTAVAATINNIGPGLSDVGPMENFYFFSVPSKLVLIFDMIAGRLELIPMLILFSPATWRNK